MKLGNISQSIIPVQKFFLNKGSLDLFTSSYYNNYPNSSVNSPNISKKKKKNNIKYLRNKSYFRTKDILSLNCDLNINLNPRSFERNSTTDNKERYIPLYHLTKYQNNAEKKETYFPDIIDMNPSKTNYNMPLNQSNLQKYKEYTKKMNIQNVVNPDLRKDIIHESKNLIQRINMNYDIKKWNNFDSRTTLNRFHQTAYSPLSDAIQNNISDKDAFSMTLREKALSLKTVSNKSKDAIKKALVQNEFENDIKNNEEKINNENTDLLLENNRNNFLKLKYNNCDAPQYNEKDKKFILEKRLITNEINRTKLYKEFPSYTREEFNKIKFYKIKEPLKLMHFDNSRGFISKEKYGFKNINSNADELTSCQDPMWIRPLHEDAFKLKK